MKTPKRSFSSSTRLNVSCSTSTGDRSRLTNAETSSCAVMSAVIEAFFRTPFFGSVAVSIPASAPAPACQELGYEASLTSRIVPRVNSKVSQRVGQETASGHRAPGRRRCRRAARVRPVRF